MEFRVVERSSLTLETDLPPSSRDIYPSGVLHAVRLSPRVGRVLRRGEQHAFAWVDDTLDPLFVGPAVSRLERIGFDRSSRIVLIPYSTRRNWEERYPHAPLLSDDGEAADVRDGTNIKSSGAEANVPSNAARLPDDARDELHAEIHAYLSWLHRRLKDLEPGEEASTADEDSSDPGGGQIKNRGNGGSVSRRGDRRQKRKVDATELRGALDKLELAFGDIVPTAKWFVAGLGDGRDGPRAVPLLENALGEELGRLAAARKSARETELRGQARLASDENNYLKDDASEEERVTGDDPGWVPAVIKSEPASEEEGVLRNDPGCLPAAIKSEPNCEDRPYFYEESGNCYTEEPNHSSESSGSFQAKYKVFEQPDKPAMRVPPDWDFKNIRLRPMYHMWHRGSEAQGVPPIKSWGTDDIKAMTTKRASITVSEIRRVMTAIDRTAALNGAPPGGAMNRTDADRCFDAGKGVINLRTEGGKKRSLEKMSYSTAVRNLPRTFRKFGDG